MRSVLLFLSINFILFSVINPADWDYINKGVPGGLNTIDFVDENNGWLAGLTAGLFKTSDGGKTWQKIELNLNVQINQIDFINTQIGYATGWLPDSGKSVILKSIDGGISWICKYSSPDITVYKIFVTSQYTVYAIAYPSVILKTTNGGEEWHDVAPLKENVSYQSMWFFNNQEGVIIGSYSDPPEYGSLILHTYDGGNKWNEKREKNIYFSENLQFLPSSYGFFTAQNDSGQNLFCFTEDSCKSWTIQSKQKDYISTFWAFSEDTVFAIFISSENFIGINQIIVKSTDKGKTWENTNSLSNWVYNKIYFKNNNGFILGMTGGLSIGEEGSGGILFRSSDNGQTWDLSILSYPFSEICFIDKNTGFVAGGSTDFHFLAGDVFRTNNSGKNWDLNFSPGNLITACQFLDVNNGYILSNAGFIYRTANSGENWQLIYENNWDSTGINLDGRDLFFVDPETGWIAGNYWDSESNYGAIFKSEDAGKSWDISWDIPYTQFRNNNLLDLFFLNKQTGWAVGESGLVIKYTEQNGWQKTDFNTDLPLKKVWFTDENRGWIIGGFFDYQGGSKSTIFKTTNGGEDWESEVFTGEIFEDIWFDENGKGWIVGFNQSHRGFIKSSIDDGNSWQTEVENLESALRAIYFKDGFGWAAGDIGLILKTEDGATWIDERSGKVVSNFYLYQNYPNPFNPTTTIEYNVRAQNFVPQQVELSIYNLMGQKVATLVSEKQKAGNYKFEWDATGFSSGIYFYRLQTEKGIGITKKLVLMK